MHHNSEHVRCFPGEYAVGSVDICGLSSGFCMEQDAGDGCVEGHPAPARALLFWRSFAQCVDPVGTQDSIDAGDGTGQYVAGAAFTEGRARLQVLKGVSVGIQDDGFRALHHGYGHVLRPMLPPRGPGTEGSPAAKPQRGAPSPSGVA